MKLLCTLRPGLLMMASSISLTILPPGSRVRYTHRHRQTHTQTHAHTHKRTHGCTHIHTHTLIHTHTCARACTHACTSAPDAQFFLILFIFYPNALDPIALVLRNRDTRARTHTESLSGTMLRNGVLAT